MVGPRSSYKMKLANTTQAGGRQLIIGDRFFCCTEAIIGDGSRGLELGRSPVY